MNAYNYVGFDASGRRVSGEIAATSSEQAEALLESKSIVLVSIEGGAKAPTKERPKLEFAKPSTGHKNAKTMEAAVILRNLAVMTENGVALVDALDGVIDSVRNEHLREKLERIREDIVGGRSLSASIRNEPGLFPPLICDMVRVAEDGGQLSAALGGAATYLERAANLKRKVMNALLYPSIMAFIAFATVAILVVLILPNFQDIFTQMSVELPLSTRVMMGTGTFLRNNFVLSMVLCTAGFFALRAYARTEKGAKLFSRLVLKVPIVGDLVRKLSISRAFQSVAALLSGNVPLIVALEHGGRVAGNVVVMEGMMTARDSVEQGASLSDALSKSKVFPKILTQMVVAGERTGKLAAMLQPMATAMEDEADSQLKALTSIIEPIIVVAMGVVVGFVTLAIVIPIFSIADKF